MKKLACILLIMAAHIVSATQGSGSIVAIVNDTPITFYDFQLRKKMIMALNNITDPDKKTLAEMNAAVVNLLIEEELLFQHAQKVNGTVTEIEIDNAVDMIAQRNKTTRSELYKFFSDRQINFNAFRDQVKAELIKMNILSSLNKTVVITPNEIDSFIMRTNTKDVKVALCIFTSKNKTDTDLKKMYKLQKNIKNCDKLTESMYSSFAIKQDIEGNLQSLDKYLQTIIKDLRVNHASSVFDTQEGFKVVLLSNKEISNVTSEENEYVTNFLTNKKISLKAQKFFEDLRKKAYIRMLLVNED